LASYTYRDVWPLCTVVLLPRDRVEGWVLWAKVGLATFRGLVFPLFEPFPYIPVDPAVWIAFPPSKRSHGFENMYILQNPSEEPNPEQTASLATWAIFSYLDSVILYARRVQHVTPEHFPPLADYDHVEYLTKKSYPVRLLRFLLKTNVFLELLDVFSTWIPSRALGRARTFLWVSAGTSA
jgi:hypothetical protein